MPKPDFIFLLKNGDTDIPFGNLMTLVEAVSHKRQYQNIRRGLIRGGGVFIYGNYTIKHLEVVRGDYTKSKN